MDHLTEGISIHMGCVQTLLNLSLQLSHLRTRLVLLWNALNEVGIHNQQIHKVYDILNEIVIRLVYSGFTGIPLTCPLLLNASPAVSISL